MRYPPHPLPNHYLIPTQADRRKQKSDSHDDSQVTRMMWLGSLVSREWLVLGLHMPSIPPSKAHFLGFEIVALPTCSRTSAVTQAVNFLALARSAGSARSRCTRALYKKSTTVIRRRRVAGNTFPNARHGAGPVSVVMVQWFKACSAA